MLYHLHQSQCTNIYNIYIYKYLYACHYDNLLGIIKFRQHSLQFRDRSLDADSSGLPNTVEDVDVDDSALENSLACSYWFRACEETWTGDKGEESPKYSTSRYTKCELQKFFSQCPAIISMMEGPCHSDVLFWHVRFFFNPIWNLDASFWLSKFYHKSLKHTRIPIQNFKPREVPFLTAKVHVTSNFAS